MVRLRPQSPNQKQAIVLVQILVENIQEGVLQARCDFEVEDFCTGDQIDVESVHVVFSVGGLGLKFLLV